MMKNRVHATKLPSLILALVAMIVVTFPTGAAEPKADLSVEQQTGKLEDQLRSIADLQTDIHRLEAAADETEGAAARVLGARVDRKWVEVLDRTRGAAETVLDLESRGIKVAIPRAQVIELLEQTSRAIRERIESAKRSFRATDPYGKELTPAAESELLGQRDRIIERIMRLYDALRTEISLMEKLGLDTSRSEARLRDAIEDGAETLSVHLELATDDVKLTAERLKTLPDDDVLKSRLTIARKRIRDIAGWMTAVVKVMDELKMDTTEYRQQLVTATGNIGSDILSVSVMRQLAGRAYRNSSKWLSANGPTLAVKALLVVLVMLAAWVLARLAGRLMRRTLDASRFDVSQLLRHFAITTVRRLVLLLGLLIALSQVGIPVGPALAGLGVAGFIIGFALQDTLSNFASGIMILFYRPYDVEDVVEAGGVLGKVSGMSLVNTTILTFDNQKIIVPNKKIWGEVIKNITAEDIRRVDLKFGISYRDDIPKAENILREIVGTHPKVLTEPASVVRLHALGESSVDFVVRPWSQSGDYWDVYWDITREVKLRFDREGISIPFPQRDVHVHMAGDSTKGLPVR